MDYSINCHGRLFDLTTPQVMGIVNITPDSFYAASRQQTEQAIAARVRQIVDEGGTMVDVGACSTRPGSQPVGQQEEMERLRLALPVVRRTCGDAVISVDTFRPDVARMAVEEYGVDIINDVGEGPAQASSTSSSADAQHPSPWGRLGGGVPLVLMSRQSSMHDILIDLARRADQLRSVGQKDLIVDPGFGFGKTLEQNYAVLNSLDALQLLQLPVLVGLSRKSMVYRLLDTDADHALNGTTALHAIALSRGASILRVHDVRAAVECVRLHAAQSYHLDDLTAGHPTATKSETVKQ